MVSPSTENSMVSFLVVLVPFFLNSVMVSIIFSGTAPLIGYFSWVSFWMILMDCALIENRLLNRSARVSVRFFIIDEIEWFLQRVGDLLTDLFPFKQEFGTGLF